MEFGKCHSWGLWGSSPSLLCHSLVIQIQLLGFFWSFADFQGICTAIFLKAKSCSHSNDNPDHGLALLRRGQANSPISMILKMKIQLVKKKIIIFVKFLNEENVELLLHLLWFPLGVFCSFHLTTFPFP